MVWIPGSTFRMGGVGPHAKPDEEPAHDVRLDGFWMDAHEVTNADFAKFVEATGYVTTAEQVPDVEEIMKQQPPGTPPPPKANLVPGALVFSPPPGKTLEDCHGQWWMWWKWQPGASWRHPQGPGSTIEGLEQHPVVQVSWDDAVAYARWAKKRLPTEAEWEYAARGGLASQPFIWGSERPRAGRKMNAWQGEFPIKNELSDGFATTAPVGSFDPNGYGLFDMPGNVWEWCADWYHEGAYRMRADRVARNPKGPTKAYDPDEPTNPKRVTRGGSFLCSESYCLGYRPSARMKTSPDTGLVHTGFRCVVTPRMRATAAPR